MQPLEAGMETFLLDLVPALAQGWGGARPEEIDRIEALAGRALPPFYRWFLGRFGQDMGPLRYRSLDFSCKAILAAYADARVEPDPRYLLIAYDHDPVYPNHSFYDLEQQVRDDALVMKGESIDEEELVPSFETLREMIAWGALFSNGVRKHPQRCVGMLESSSDDARLQLGEALETIGFVVPISTGRYCGVFRGPGMDLVSLSKPGENPHLQGIDVGAADATKIRRLLGEIARTTSLELKISQWDPALP